MKQYPDLPVFFANFLAIWRAIGATMQAKFSIGDKVRFTERVPSYIGQDLRRRTRTVVDILHDLSHRCCYYELGDRGKGTLGYWFRSFMLVCANGNQHTRGRPQKFLLSPSNQNLTGLSPN